eukprot:TRINITY_DN42900_c0_g1_i1.p1 TRINITY_DN42900_c0_g1~~TRINITY_DN42900_c0_g1_i1.p1  ORF type:complete len:430 (+),score=88.40 TRINITY_DN42900_c0_g1_i1:28-1317(+)
MQRGFKAALAICAQQPLPGALAAQFRGMAAQAAEVTPRPSKRIRQTDEPCIVAMQRMLRGKEGILSLAQGIVHWAPPQEATEAAAKAAREPDTNAYCPDDGLPALRDALKAKLREENGLEGVEVMVTAGANQAYANLVCALLDADDSAVLFSPFYFNHRMALQMTGGGENVILAPTTKDYLPDADWLEKRLTDPPAGERVKLVTVVNPGNPTGVTLPRELLERFSAMCARHNVWLVVDNTYEHFTYEQDGHPEHCCLAGDHVVNVFSFSKAFGMMGWRVGYLAFPPRLGPELMKVQDTIAICPTVCSQKVALGALSAGRSWVKERVQGLRANRKVVISAAEAALGPGCIAGGSGAIYLLLQLPQGLDDVRVVEWLSDKHKVCAIPGAACGAPGVIRLCYANLSPERCVEASARLEAGLRELKQRGLDDV